MIFDSKDVLEITEGENAYLDLVAEIYEMIDTKGFDNIDRTGVGTQGVFARQLRFDLAKEFPLFTHKKVFMRGIFEELMWFLRGDTNIKTLLEKNVHIWTEWRYKDYINTTFKETIENGWCGAFPTMQWFEQQILNDPEFARKWGDIGKGYGYQWRNFGEQEVDTIAHNSRGDECSVTAGFDGFDQIKWVINEIKTNPSSRRLIVSGWNPHDVAQVDLPPCHTLFQFFVRDGKLSCQLYQRSADLLLGVPFNIASYALLTHLVALECGLEVGEFVWVGGDIHIYSNQIEGLDEIMTRGITRLRPQIEIKKRDSIFDYEWSDINIKNYDPYDKVSMPVAV